MLVYLKSLKQKPSSFKILLLSVLFYNVKTASLQLEFENKIEKNSQSVARIFPFCRLNDEICCEEAYINYKLNWDTGELPLTGLLENFRQSNCSHFEYECNKRTFAYTKFTQLVYDRFCEYETFRNNCNNGKYISKLKPTREKRPN